MSTAQSRCGFSAYVVNGIQWEREWKQKRHGSGGSRRSARCIDGAIHGALYGALAGLAALAAGSRADAVTINPTFDASVTSNVNSAAIQNAFNYAALQMKNLYSDPINVNINVVAAPGTSILGQSSTQLLGFLTYAQQRTSLINDATSSADISSTNALPVADPTPAGSSFLIARAQAKALNVVADDLTTDGTFTFGAGFTYTFNPASRAVGGAFDFIGVATHEITEIMGRIALEGQNLAGQPDYIANDLFRFKAGPSRSVAAGDVGVFFSVDNGVTNLKNFNAPGNGGDIADYASGANDSFNAFSSTGVMNPITPVGVTNMDVIGYNLHNLVWSGNANGTTWDIFNTANWNNGAPSAKYTDSSLVVFDDTNVLGNNIALAQTVFPTTITINSTTNNYNFSGAGTIAGATSLAKSGGSTATITGLTLSYTGATTVTAGKLSLGTNLTTTSSVTITGGTLELTPLLTRVLRTPSLLISGSGKLDLQNNKLITAANAGSWNGANYTGVTGLIQLGRGTGTWNGSTGIITSQSQATTSNLTTIGVATAAQVKGIANTATAVFAGQVVTGTDTLAMYTYGGDATLDGKINVDDYTRIDFNVGLGNHGWFNGDFNYDGKINVDDYTIIDFNVGIQGAQFPTAGGVFASGATAAIGGSGVGLPITSVVSVPTSAVPEPATAGLLALAAAVFAGRRRRR
jgi:autotransporter-associated beta strand protein